MRCASENLCENLCGPAGHAAGQLSTVSQNAARVARTGWALQGRVPRLIYSLSLIRSFLTKLLRLATWAMSSVDKHERNRNHDAVS